MFDHVIGVGQPARWLPGSPGCLPGRRFASRAVRPRAERLDRPRAGWSLLCQPTPGSWPEPNRGCGKPAPPPDLRVLRPGRRRWGRRYPRDPRKPVRPLPAQGWGQPRYRPQAGRRCSNSTASSPPRGNPTSSASSSLSKRTARGSGHHAVTAAGPMPASVSPVRVVALSSPAWPMNSTGPVTEAHRQLPRRRQPADS